MSKEMTLSPRQQWATDLVLALASIDPEDGKGMQSIILRAYDRAFHAGVRAAMPSQSTGPAHG